MHYFKHLSVNTDVSNNKNENKIRMYTPVITVIRK